MYDEAIEMCDEVVDGVSRLLDSCRAILKRVAQGAKCVAQKVKRGVSRFHEKNKHLWPIVFMAILMVIVTALGGPGTDSQDGEAWTAARDAYEGTIDGLKTRLYYAEMDNEIYRQYISDLGEEGLI